MSMKIWVVWGTSGEYSERAVWDVCAYADEAMAKAHVEKLTEWLQQQDTSKWDDLWWKDGGVSITCPFDPTFQCGGSSNLPSWGVSEIELRDALP